MPFVTTLRLRSGDRDALDGVVEDIRRTAQRKGVELRGPHTSQPKRFRVPLFRRLEGRGGRFPAWEYTVYERVIELSGHDESVRRLAGWDVPAAVHVEVSVEQVRSAGSG
jgi:ribosomal protein S10